MTIPAKTPPINGDIMESVLLKGDLAKLTQGERVEYYNAVCKSMGLNPLTQPFAYITLNGKLQLYALRNCTDQLRMIHSVSLEIVSRDVADGILTIHVRARFPDGRSDEDLGAVSFPDSLRGETRANAELKAVTKAKRRATLSICGLSWLDETEIADIPASAKKPVAAPNVMVPHDPNTGEISLQDEQVPASGPAGVTPPVSTDASQAAGGAAPTLQDHEELAAETAAQFDLKATARAKADEGARIFNQFYKNLTPAQQTALTVIGDDLRSRMEAAKAKAS